MIKNLIFDWGGVLSVSRHDEAVRRFAAMGVPHPETYFVEGKNWEGIFGEVEDGSISIDDFLTQVSDLCGKPVSFEQVAYAWWGFFSHLAPGILKQLEKWKREGFYLYMLTNNNPFMMSYIRSDDFAPDGKPFHAYFDQLYVSCDIGFPNLIRLFTNMCWTTRGWSLRKPFLWTTDAKTLWVRSKWA